MLIEPDLNYLLKIAYDGTSFSGWQVQTNKRTVQAEIEKALQTLFQKKIRLHGAGRTDTGVHALNQAASFSTSNTMPTAKIKKALNALLPDDILINSCTEVSQEFHPRFSAKKKIYKYTFQYGYDRPVLNRHLTYHYRGKVDFLLLEKACEKLQGTHDFRGFSCLRGNETGTEDTVRTIFDISYSNKKPIIEITFKGNGFLYKMIRILMGTILKVSSEKMPLEKIDHIFEQRNSQLAGFAVPSKGLTLMEVEY